MLITIVHLPEVKVNIISAYFSLMYKSLKVAFLSLKSRLMTYIKTQKKKKRNNLIADWLGYVALRILVVFLSFFNIKTNLSTASFLGRLLWKHYHRGRNRAIENLRASFPGKSEQWIRRTGQRSFEHIEL